MNALNMLYMLCVTMMDMLAKLYRKQLAKSK